MLTQFDVELNQILFIPDTSSEPLELVQKRAWLVIIDKINAIVFTGSSLSILSGVGLKYLPNFINVAAQFTPNISVVRKMELILKIARILTICGTAGLILNLCAYSFTNIHHRLRGHGHPPKWTSFDSSI